MEGLPRTIRLGVNIDHVATLRQLRAGTVDYPDIIAARDEVIRAGAEQITIHLRGDRRHIQDHDLDVLAANRKGLLNLEMAATDEMLQIALKHKPDYVCLVPEKREEVTTEGGLDVVKHKSAVARVTEVCHKAGIKVSLFIEADEKQVRASQELRADAVEFHTGQYALARGEKQEAQLAVLREAFDAAHAAGIAVHAGHGLDYRNVIPLVELPHLQELNIGHSIVCRAVMVGLYEAVREMKELLAGAGVMTGAGLTR